MALSLKHYQRRSLETLGRFLERARVAEPGSAFARTAEHDGKGPPTYRAISQLEEVPYVCLRIPTGGGKTILGAHIIRTAAETYLERDLPLVLWLVPTTQIKTQTLDAFRNTNHPYRRELDDSFSGRVAVFDIADIDQICPTDLSERVCVVLATFATARVQNTEIRDFYAHKEALEPHFKSLGVSATHLDKSEAGGVAYSFANLLKIHRPLVITDEAHNATTSLSYEVYQRLAPSAIVELTATPDTKSSNVLVNVSASELKAEEMIKLPVVLTEHPGAWEAALRDALLRRKSLAELAEVEQEYLRPILLIQAENDNQTVTVDAIYAHLIENEHIANGAIAIATGDQHDLDGVDLFDRQCPVEVIITKQALKEGWDCSFAYVFCSVSNIKSARDVEQLLGRVLRMPYARRRKHEALNRAYAHVVSPTFGKAAKEITEHLEHMGFDEHEAAVNVEVQPPLGLKEPESATVARNALTLEVPTLPDLSGVPQRDRERVVIDALPDGAFRVAVNGEIDDVTQRALAAVVPRKDRAATIRALRAHSIRAAASHTPAQLFLDFRVPRLCLRVQGELELVERELLLDLNEWKLTDYRPDLSSFKFDETANTFMVDIEGEHLTYRHVHEENETYLEGLAGDWSESELVSWLDRRLRQADIAQVVMLEWARRAVRLLLDDRGFSLAQLVRGKFVLARKLQEQVNDARHVAATNGYQATLFVNEAPVEASFDHAHRFDPLVYPARSRYVGTYRFRKHYYDTPGELPFKRLDGSSAEEFICAQAIDSLDEVEFWVRNLVHDTQFWLPLASGRTYPDFVAKLRDGRLLVVEYKGGDRVSNQDSAAKRAVGELWARSSGGKGLYLMAVQRDEQGRDVRSQLVDAVRKGHAH